MVSEEKVVVKVLTVDATRCTECGLCELACSMRNVGEFNPARSRIQVIRAKKVIGAGIMQEDPVDPRRGQDDGI